MCHLESYVTCPTPSVWFTHKQTFNQSESKAGAVLLAWTLVHTCLMATDDKLKENLNLSFNCLTVYTALTPRLSVRIRADLLVCLTVWCHVWLQIRNAHLQLSFSLSRRCVMSLKLRKRQNKAQVTNESFLEKDWGGRNKIPCGVKWGGKKIPFLHFFHSCLIFLFHNRAENIKKKCS